MHHNEYSIHGNVQSFRDVQTRLRLLIQKFTINDIVARIQIEVYQGNHLVDVCKVGQIGIRFGIKYEIIATSCGFPISVFVYDRKCLILNYVAIKDVIWYSNNSSYTSLLRSRYFLP